MLDNVEKVIEVLFKRVSVQDIIAGNWHADDIGCDDFVQIMLPYLSWYSETEIKNLYFYLVDEFCGKYSEISEIRHLDVFILLRVYAGMILDEQDNEIVCKYDKMFHWREATVELSEDLFITGFLESRKSFNVLTKPKFNWNPVITHNNKELHTILQQGMAENHSHLKGAAPVFLLSWISIMNNPYLYINATHMEQLEKKKRNFNKQYSIFYQETPLQTKIIQATCIRCVLLAELCPELELKNALRMNGIYDAIWYPENTVPIKYSLSQAIHYIQNFFCEGEMTDYALVGLMLNTEMQDVLKNEEDDTLIFQGERWLLYHGFQKIFSGDKKFKKNLFYAYLVIRENFRSELVQNNQRIGFENFSIYEGRKDTFLQTPFFEKELVKKAVWSSIKEPAVKTSEQRIAPKDTTENMLKYIKKLDAYIDPRKEYRKRFFYTVHFIKTGADREKSYFSDYMYMYCRHYKQRMKYKKQAIALITLRKQYPLTAARICGIDAANMEIGCGPEVFGQVFRYLSNHIVDQVYNQDVMKNGLQTHVPQLRITYHVGEDYLDIVSGLRAIDEALTFLGMRCGDRLGHALALGIDASKWYANKNYRILLPGQEYLDNIAWMHHVLSASDTFQNGNILNKLKSEFEHYFQKIYKNIISQDYLNCINIHAQENYKNTKWEKHYSPRNYNFTIEDYFSAWALRGDNPELYRLGFYNNKKIIDNLWRSFDYYAINRDLPIKQEQRYIQETAVLYYFYHFDMHVRREGEKPIEKKIEKWYIECVNIIQKELQNKVVAKGIGIETNPSSNFAIGHLERYEYHPIVNLYNRHLTEDLDKLRDCTQLNVSINTDDAGIFSTSLQNEYAYMALAMEKAKDKNGNNLYKRQNVYDWIDHIRIMGLRQTFDNGSNEACR